MSQAKKSISFENGGEPNVPITGPDCIEIMDPMKSNYSTIHDLEGGQFVSNYSTVTSNNSAPYVRDTALLLHREHKLFTQSREDKIRRRSRNATFCFIFAIFIILVLVVIAAVSLHHKLTDKSHSDDLDHQNITIFNAVGNKDINLNLGDTKADKNMNLSDIKEIALKSNTTSNFFL